MRPRIGVLALQGAFAAHARVLTDLGADAVEVRRPDQLDGVDALVMPGGESTTMSMLLESSGLFDPLAKRLADGLPVLGTCAGMILLAVEVVDGRPDQRSFGAIDLTVRRNAYGRQVDSFETDLDVPELGPAPFHAVFIRAPGVDRAGADVDVLASWEDRPVLARQGAVTVAAFHPRALGRCPHPLALPRGGRLVMSGHSKWATIKHQKGAKDKARGKLFAKLIRQVEVAAREGGGDIEANATLRTMYNKARSASVPIDTIERAIKRGTGELDGVTYESITYEGYAPGGVALLIDVLTDNRNRTGAEVRSLFSKMGGSMAEPGSVAWQFTRTGVVMVPRSVSEDDIMLAALEAGAEDIADDGDTWRLTCPPQATETVREALEAAGVTVLSAESTMLPSTTIEVTEADEAKKVLRIMDALEEHDDVQDVYSNFDIPEEILAASV